MKLAFPHLTEILTPPGNPTPGSQFGGALPSEILSSSISRNGGISPLKNFNTLLDTIPYKAIPVSIFPPFALPRTFEAKSVIFMEDPDILKYPVKRSLLSDAQKWISLYVRGYKTIEKQFKCLHTRIFALSHRNEIKAMQRKSRFLPHYKNRRKIEIEDINSIDDCIEGIEEPLYGFRINITLLKDSPCILGSTCDMSSNYKLINDYYDKQSFESYGKDFLPLSRPKCLVQFSERAPGCQDSKNVYNNYFL